MTYKRYKKKVLTRHPIMSNCNPNAHAAKRCRLNIQGGSRDRVLHDDNHIYFVRHREQGLTSRGLVSRNAGIPQRGATELTPSGNIWLPEDNTQLGLEADGVRAVQEIDRLVMDCELDSTKPKAKATKSRLAVSV
jgi:hypothetical protein